VKYAKCLPFGEPQVEEFAKSPAAAGHRFGNAVVLSFVCVQWLDGVFTYLGVRIWGLPIEANPILSSAVAHAGLAPGLAAAKLIAISLGIVLHLRETHAVIAWLTAFYIAVAILPWTFLFLR
jgi:hypothetical protein